MQRKKSNSCYILVYSIDDLGIPSLTRREHKAVLDDFSSTFSDEPESYGPDTVIELRCGWVRCLVFTGFRASGKLEPLSIRIYFTCDFKPEAL